MDVSYEPTSIDPYLPGEVWNRIFSLLDAPELNIFTTMCAKSVREWSIGLITDLLSETTVCPPSALTSPNLKRIILPFGPKYDVEHIRTFELPISNLLELQLGKHPLIHLEALFQSCPILQLLHLGQLSYRSSGNWSFVPRTLHTFMVADVKVEKVETRTRRTLPQFPPIPLPTSPFNNMPPNLRKLSIQRLVFEGDPNMNLLPDFSMLIYGDFIVNCLQKLRHLEHLHLPTYLKVFVDDYTFDKHEMHPIPLLDQLVTHPTLTYLSCDVAYRVQDPTIDVLMLNGWKDDLPPIGSLSGSMPLTASLGYFLPNLRHFEVQSRHYAPFRVQVVKNMSHYLPTSLTSYHDLTLHEDFEALTFRGGAKFFILSRLTQIDFPTNLPSLTSLSLNNGSPLLTMIAEGHAKSLTAVSVRNVPPQNLYAFLAQLCTLSTHLSKTLYLDIPHPEIEEMKLDLGSGAPLAYQLLAQVPGAIEPLLRPGMIVQWFTLYGMLIKHPLHNPNPDWNTYNTILAKKDFIPFLFDWFIDPNQHCHYFGYQNKLREFERIHGPSVFDLTLQNPKQIELELLAAAFPRLSKLEQYPLHPVHYYLARFTTIKHGLNPEDVPNFVKFARSVLKWGFSPNHPSLLQLCGYSQVLKLLLQFGLLVREQKRASKVSSQLPPTALATPSVAGQLQNNLFAVASVISSSPEKEGCILLLAEYRVNLNLANELGRTWLHIAIEQRSHKIVSLLLRAKIKDSTGDYYAVDIEKADNFGTTPRMEALDSGFAKIVEAMNARIRNQQGNEVNITSQNNEMAFLGGNTSRGSPSSSAADQRRKREEAKWEQFHK